MYLIEFIFMAVSIGMSLALLILLPISNAIDDAPTRLYIIYQASVTFFAALIAFQLIFTRNTSIFDVFVKAINAEATKFQSSMGNTDKKLKDACKLDDTKVWTKMSNREKEYYLAKWVLSAVIPTEKQVEGPKTYELKFFDDEGSQQPPQSLIINSDEGGSAMDPQTE